jgi:hypothetical protein
LASAAQPQSVISANRLSRYRYDVIAVSRTRQARTEPQSTDVICGWRFQALSADYTARYRPNARARPACPRSHFASKAILPAKLFCEQGYLDRRAAEHDYDHQPAPSRVGEVHQ